MDPDALVRLSACRVGSEPRGVLLLARGGAEPQCVTLMGLHGESLALFCVRN